MRIKRVGTVRRQVEKISPLQKDTKLGEKYERERVRELLDVMIMYTIKEIPSASGKRKIVIGLGLMKGNCVGFRTRCGRRMDSTLVLI